jgi:hypothetical protein
MNIDSLLDLGSTLVAFGTDGQKVPGKITGSDHEDEFVFEPECAMNASVGSVVKVSDGQDSVLAKVVELTDQGMRLCIECYASPGHERREDFRIYDKIYYQARLLCHASEKPDKLPAAIERIRSNKLIIDSFLKGKYGYPGSDTEPYSRETPFNQSIWEINRKLDLLIHMVLAEEFRELMKTTPSDVNISASGVRFISGKGYEVGDILEIHLILPMVPLLFIGLVGEVIRQKEIRSSKFGRYAVAVKFIRVEHDTKDDIIRYLFRRQREVLRKRQE